MVEPICPYGKARPEVSANEGLFLKSNQIHYKDYFASRPLTDDLALNTQIIQQHGGIVYDHYERVGNRGSGGLRAFGTSSSIDLRIRDNNVRYGYKPSQLVENIMEDRDGLNPYAPAAPRTSLREFSNQLKAPTQHMSTEAQLEARRQFGGLVGMHKSTHGNGGLLKTGNSSSLPGGQFRKTASLSTPSRDEQSVLNQFRANKLKVTGSRHTANDDDDSIDSISFEEI